VDSDSIPPQDLDLNLTNILDAKSEMQEVGGNQIGADTWLELESPVEKKNGDALTIYNLELAEKQRKRAIVTSVFAWLMWVLFATSIGLSVYYITLVVLDYLHHSEIGTLEWGCFVFFGLVMPIVTGSAAILICCRIGRANGKPKDNNTVS